MQVLSEVEVRFRELLDTVARAITETVKEPSPSAVHVVRVASRRFETATILCRDSIRGKDFRLFRKYCRKLRRLTDKTRNCDVVLHSLSDSHQECVKNRNKLEAMRHKLGSRLIRSLKSLSSDNRYSRLQSRVAFLASPDSEELTNRRLIQLTSRFAHLAAAGRMNLKKIHRWRVATKRVRYGIEFLEACGRARNCERVLQRLESMQNRLGEITDQMIAEKNPTRSMLTNPRLAIDVMPELGEVKRTLLELFDILEDHATSGHLRATEADISRVF